MHSGTAPLACLVTMLHSQVRGDRVKNSIFFKLPGRMSLFTLKVVMMHIFCSHSFTFFRKCVCWLSLEHIVDVFSNSVDSVAVLISRKMPSSGRRTHQVLKLQTQMLHQLPHRVLLEQQRGLSRRVVTPQKRPLLVVRMMVCKTLLGL